MDTAVAKLLEIATDPRGDGRCRVNAGRSALRELISASEEEWRPAYEALSEIAANEARFRPQLRQESLAALAWFDRRRKRSAASMALVIDADNDAPGPTSALEQLRKIVLSAAPLSAKLTAAEAIATFENAPGSVNPDDADSDLGVAYQFCRQLSETPGIPEAVRIRALKMRLICESKKALPVQAAVARARRETLRKLVNAERSAALRKAGVWQRVVASGEQWGLLVDDEFDAELPPAVLDVDIEQVGVGAAMAALGSLSPDLLAQHAAARRQILLGVRATNRADDWQRLLEGAAAA